MVAALAASTLAGYELFLTRYGLFCQAVGLPTSKAWPPSTATIIAFVCWLVQCHTPARGDGHSYGNVQKALCALKAACKFAGLPLASFTNPRLELFMRGVRKKLGGAKKDPRLPLVFALVAALCDAWRGGDMAPALFLVAFFGLFRPGEVTLAPGSTFLPRANVEWFADYVRIRLDASKTDIFRRGAHVIVAAGTGAPAHCGFRALRKAWEGAKNKKPMAALFQRDDGSPLTYENFRAVLKQAIDWAGFKGRFSPHSFRIGGATELAQRGVPGHIIKAMGRWSSECYQRYVRLPASFVKDVSKSMGEGRAAREGVSTSLFGGLPLSKVESASFEDTALNLYA